MPGYRPAQEVSVGGNATLLLACRSVRDGAVDLGQRGTLGGDPSLEIIRRYYLPGNDLVEVSVSIHPGDRFAYVTRMARG